jgi:DNA-binding transcriptional ArsR family regulator
VSPLKVKRSDYVYKLLAAAPTMKPEVHRAIPVALALAGTANADGTRACLSGPQLTQLLSTGQGDRTVMRHLSVLRDAGWIVQTERGRKAGNKGKASIYTLSQPATGGMLGAGPNLPRHTLQPATAVAASCSSKEELRAHSGARSPEVARDPVRVAELEATWSKVVDGGADEVFDWVAHHSEAASPLTADWLLLHGEHFCDLDKWGKPGTGSLWGDRVLWMCGIYPHVDDAVVARWTWQAVGRALTAAVNHGLTQSEGWAALHYLATEPREGKFLPPSALERLLDEVDTSAYAEVMLRRARADLERWTATAAERKTVEAAVEDALPEPPRALTPPPGLFPSVSATSPSPTELAS